MAAIPLWAIGRNVTACTLTPQTVNPTTGVLTDTTPVASFFGHLQSLDIESDVELNNLSSMDRPQKNFVPIEFGTRVRISEFVKSAGPNLAMRAFMTGTYYKYVIARGGQSFTGYGVIASCRMSATKPTIIEELVLEPIDVGSGNPVYA